MKNARPSSPKNFGRWTFAGEKAGQSLVAVREVLRRFGDQGRPSQEDALRHAEGAARGRVSKFQACLPDPLVLDMLVRAVLDVEGARRALD